MPANLIGLKPGDEVELSRELVVKAFATKHTIPSLGLSRLGAPQEAQARIPGPLWRPDPRPAALGRRGLGRGPAAQGRLHGRYGPGGSRCARRDLRVQILILEMTFVAPNERPSLIHKFGHTHLDDLIARADRFENEVIIASHFSTRLHPDQIQRIVEKSLPDSLRGRLKVWL